MVDISIANGWYIRWCIAVLFAPAICGQLRKLPDDSAISRHLATIKPPKMGGSILQYMYIYIEREREEKKVIDPPIVRVQSPFAMVKTSIYRHFPMIFPWISQVFPTQTVNLRSTEALRSMATLRRVPGSWPKSRAAPPLPGRNEVDISIDRRLQWEDREGAEKNHCFKALICHICKKNMYYTVCIFR
jgi:hypothetical protein